MIYSIALFLVHLGTQRTLEGLLNTLALREHLSTWTLEGHSGTQALRELSHLVT